MSHSTSKIALSLSAVLSQLSFASTLPVVNEDYDLIQMTRVPGTVEAFTGMKDKDDFVAGALVLPTLRAEDLLQFQVDSLLAPDEELVAGPLKADVPGNLYIPSQRENYGIIPLTIKKEAFGFYGTPGRTEELMAISFNVKFSTLAKMAQDKQPFTKMIPLVSLAQYRLTEERDWTRERSIKIALNQNFQKRVNYRWTRPAAPETAADLIVNFQRTPAGRWMITDLSGSNAATGKLATAPSLGDAPTRAYFARLKNDANGKLGSGEGYFVAPSASGHEIQGFPEAIRNAAVRGTQISWKPITGPGWMAILRVKKKSGFAPSPLVSLFGDEGDVSVPFERSQKLEGWVNASTGSASLTNALGSGEGLVLLFVGASQEVPAPTPNAEDPELFTYATDIRFVSVP